MDWYEVNCQDPKTGEWFTTQERSTDQYSAELKAQARLIEEGEDLVVVSKFR